MSIGDSQPEVMHCTQCKHEYALEEGRAPQPKGTRLWMIRHIWSTMGMLLGLGVGYLVF